MRVVSSWTVYANGEPWELLNGGAISYYASRIFLTNGSLPTEEGTIPPRTLGFIISRWISGGMHEDLGITNNSQKAVKFQLEIAVRCDFANIFEVKSGNIVRRGRITKAWSESRQVSLAARQCHNRDGLQTLWFELRGSACRA